MLLADLPSLNISFAQVLVAVAAVVAVVLVLATLVLYTTSRQYEREQSRHWLSSLAYGAYLFLIAALAVTAFGSLLVTGQVLGYALLFHVAASGGFVFLMVAIVFLFLPTAADKADVHSGRREIWWASRWSAWALVLSSLVAAGTMLVSMLPLLDTEGLLQMAVLHRYAGLAVVVSAIFHLYSLACVRLGWR
ncbi:MAG: hypothetical protein KDA72_18270 [Planctomycetales bacterium]|nr:hypothetical protein [Planctomycetales bacterium]